VILARFGRICLVSARLDPVRQPGYAKSMAETLQAIVDRGLIAVVDIADEELFLQSCLALAEGGIKLLGIPATLTDVTEIVSELSEGGGLHIGISRVINTEQVNLAMMAGAHFILASVYDDEIVRMARDRGLVVIAGAVTPTEVVAASRASHLVNVFPAGALGGPEYLEFLAKQFPEIPLIASGGVDVDSAPAYIEAGAAAVIVDRGLVPEQFDPSAFEVIKMRAQTMVEVCEDASQRLDRQELKQLLAGK
jgi:2-dehydro-3-deoxyphosphogluconate aldolase/(4S)-4-hydroxy-2-oxoglutarate aldolase